jgi:hypothetical protein
MKFKTRIKLQFTLQVWHLVSHHEGTTLDEGGREQNAERNIWNQETGSNKLVKIT